MTRKFRDNIECPHCGESHTMETGFERWMRNEPDLDSNRVGLVRFDCDIVLHRYRFHGDKKGYRWIECLMFIEVKTFCAECSVAQKDTLHLFNQVLRNRRRNRYAARHGAHARDHVPLAKVWSVAKRRWIRLRLYGGHCLRLSGSDPLNSEWMEWDHKRIDVGQLCSLLRFEIDPDTLRPIDLRRRYSDFDRDIELPLKGLLPPAE